MELKIYDKSFEAFKGFVNIVKTIVEEANLRISEDGIRVNTMDPSHVAMIDTTAKPGLFDAYTSDEKEEPICFNVKDLGKFLDRMDKKEQITIKTNREKAKMMIQGRKGGLTRRFEITLLEPMEEEVPAPKITFKSKTRILTSRFERAIKDADLVSEHIAFKAEKDGEFSMSAKGELGSALSSWEKGSDEVLQMDTEEDSSATYTLNYLKDFMSALKPVADVLNVEFSDDMPLMLTAECSSTNLEAAYFLAPCIGMT